MVFMTSINFNSPASISSLLGNLKEIVEDPSSELGENLEVLKKSDKPAFSDFSQLVQKTEDLFSQLLEQDTASKDMNIYLPGRLFTRLERIAEARFGLKRGEA